MRRIALPLFLLALLLGPAVGSPPPAAAQGNDGCGADNDHICGFNFEIEKRGEIPAGEARWCSRKFWVPVVGHDRPISTDIFCKEAVEVIDCSGHVVEYHRLGDATTLCADANDAWQACCTPDSLMTDTGGFCELQDYIGNRIRLRVEVPKHRFRIVPYPVGFVAREDPWGIFHPTARLVWEPPPFPQYADSGWRLWSWGGHRGPGAADSPCDLDAAGLLARNVPAGTECRRVQLWTAPGFRGLEPTLLPALLQYPAARVNEALLPGQVVAISFPYASHPATGQVTEVQFGDQRLPAFNGYFHVEWPVRLRVEWKRVKDLTGTETRCEAVPEGQPGQPVECWARIGDPPRLWPGRWKTETVVKGKEWETGYRDGILALDRAPFHRAWPYLHPDGAIIQDGEGRTWRTGVVVRENIPWLYLPLAVREGQGAVCADPTCGGYAP